LRDVFYPDRGWPMRVGPRTSRGLGPLMSLFSSLCFYPRFSRYLSSKPATTRFFATRISIWSARSTTTGASLFRRFPGRISDTTFILVARAGRMDGTGLLDVDRGLRRFWLLCTLAGSRSPRRPETGEPGRARSNMGQNRVRATAAAGACGVDAHILRFDVDAVVLLLANGDAVVWWRCATRCPVLCDSRAYRLGRHHDNRRRFWGRSN